MINLLSISLVPLCASFFKISNVVPGSTHYTVYGIHLSHLESAHCTDNRYGNDYKFAFN